MINYGRNQVLNNKKREFFCLIFRFVYSKHHQRQNEQSEKETLQKMRGRGKRLQLRERKRRTQSRVGPPTTRRIVIHSVKDRIPHSSLDVSPQIFVKAFAWATLMTPDLKSFPNFEIVCEFTFVFI